MRVSFNFDTGTRRIRLKPEDPLEECVLKEMALLGTKGVQLKITSVGTVAGIIENFETFEIEMRINGHAEGGKKAE